MTMDIDGPLEDINTVLKKFRVKSPSTVYRWMQRGEFPQPIRLSCRCVRWRKSETDAVIEGTWKPQDQG